MISGRKSDVFSAYERSFFRYFPQMKYYMGKTDNKMRKTGQI